MSDNKLGIFLAGGLAGAAVALLVAPRSGRETRALVADTVNEAWGEAQELGSQGAASAQQAYQSAVERGQNVAQNVADKGQEVYGKASARVREAADGVQPAFSQKNDELRDKIEAARQRIASQVAQNAEESQIATGGVVEVVSDDAEAEVAEAAEEVQAAAEEVAAEAEEAADEAAPADEE